jgi:hypothetical protein
MSKADGIGDIYLSRYILVKPYTCGVTGGFLAIRAGRPRRGGPVAGNSRLSIVA